MRRASNVLVAVLLAIPLAACSSGPSAEEAQPGAEVIRWELDGIDAYTLDLPTGEKCVVWNNALQCDFPDRTAQ